jgi:predicted RNase H-like HicB family nuclease
MNAINPKHYSMNIQWDANDQIYVVTVPELPGCMTHGKTYEEAVRQGQDAIESWIECSLAEHLPVPPPRLASYVDVA